MMTPRTNKSFTITQYRDLTVEIHTAQDGLPYQGIKPWQWGVYVSYEFLYEGICSPHGPGPLDDWMPGGYFDGFLVENRGYTFRMAPHWDSRDILFPEDTPA